MIAAAMQVSHWSALVPVGYLIVTRRRYPLSCWLVAAGFAVSFLADLVALQLLSGQATWAVTHFYPPMQLGLFALACGSATVPLVLLVAAAVPVELAAPETIVTTAGSIAVLYLARSGPWTSSMLLYCGAGTFFYLLLASEVSSSRFFWFWYPYQFARLASFAIFIRQASTLSVREVLHA